MALNKEIWLAEIMEDFVPKTSWLAELRNMDAFVENNKIHLASAGVRPEVVIDPNYPLDVSKRDDVDNELSLKTYATKPTRIQRTEEIELSYDKLQSVIYGHKQALVEAVAKSAAYAIAPSANKADTPLLPTSGAADGGKNKITFGDILTLRKAFNEKNVPMEDRVLLLSPDHESDLLSEDKNLYKSILDVNKSMLYGFKVYTYSNLPNFKYDTAAKLAVGGNVTENHFAASIAFTKNEAMRSLGTFEMFSEEKEPTYQADVVSFQVRALCQPIRGKGVGAIYTKKAA